MQYAVIIVAVVFFMIPFVLWMILRFREKVKQIFAPWHKPVLISAFAICFAIFAALLAVAMTVLA